MQSILSRSSIPVYRQHHSVEVQLQSYIVCLCTCVTKELISLKARCWIWYRSTDKFGEFDITTTGNHFSIFFYKRSVVPSTRLLNLISQPAPFGEFDITKPLNWFLILFQHPEVLGVCCCWIWYRSFNVLDCNHCKAVEFDITALVLILTSIGCHTYSR